LASIQLTGDFRRVMVDSFHEASGFHHLLPPYCYRCPFGLEYPECGIACAEQVDYVIKNEGNVSALILEPVTGTNGVVVPPKEFLPRIREITKERGVILIDDEVMAGFGRTGEWFAVNHWKVEPDILTAAKGLTGAYTPLSLTGVSGEISDYFEDHYFAHGHTYEAHPLAMAAASAAIDEYKERGIIEHVKQMSPSFLARLEEIKEEHASVGDVRGIGLFGAVEIVKNRKTKEPFNTYEEKVSGKPLMVDLVAKQAMNKGVYINTWVSHFVIAPPLIIEKEDMEKGFNALDEALKISDREVEK
ncbi:MAG: aminotransferase class III-fold pyridoxal phosphate-dependent enzyme, partial [Candidatus Micrarchaeaceae archaeon]